MIARLAQQPGALRKRVRVRVAAYEGAVENLHRFRGN